jgi:IS5 family transposase
MAYLRQTSFFQGQHPKSATINIREKHELLELSDIVDWDELTEIAIDVRASRGRGFHGPTPHYRELLGAVALMAVRNVTFREAEDLIAHYAPARYLCGLMDSTWQPDHITIFEFTQMLGPDGVAMVNQSILLKAEKLGILDPSRLMSDTTAQEAQIPYPNEMGLMKRFSELVRENLKRLGGKFSTLKSKAKALNLNAKKLLRSSHLFAKTPEAKKKIGEALLKSTEDFQELLKSVLDHGYGGRAKAAQELRHLSELMARLLPQIRYFFNTGFVAAKKLISLEMPDVYSIVRGKAGKSVEFGIKWGINQVDGFVDGFLMEGAKNASDQKFAIEAIKHHVNLFGSSPQVYGFDRGGYSESNIRKATMLGVKQVGIAPTGKAAWAVSKSMSEKIRRERAQIEGAIGTAKSNRYRFNKPRARSSRSMQTYGHRSLLGMNLMKTVRKLTEKAVALK